jgi:stalled ribosome alternative rescue factor ArfA
MSEEGAKASYLRRKKAQGKAQFDRPDDPQP